MNHASSTSPEQLQVLYELSLSIGQGETLTDVARTALRSYLRRLNCSVGALFQRQETATGGVDYEMVDSIPTHPTQTDTFAVARDHLPDGKSVEKDDSFRDTLPVTGTDQESHYHLFDLPGFGVLLLIKSGSALSSALVAELGPLNKKLAGACRHRLAERSVRQTRQTLRSIIDLLPQHVFAKDENGRFLLANESLAAAYGTTVEEIEGATEDEVSTRDGTVGRRRADDHDIIETGDAKQIPEETFTTADGRERVLETTKIPYDPISANGDAELAVSTDITDRKERERELERQRTRLRALFDKSPDGITVHDAEGTVLDANETLCETLGYDQETLLSMNVVDFEVGVELSDLTSLWAEMNVRDPLKVEGKHRRQNGDTFPVEVWVNKVEVGGSERYIAVSRDTTEQKRLEGSLRESERSVRELTSIASDTDRAFEAKLKDLLELGSERLGLPYGFLNRLDGETQRVVKAVGNHPEITTGASAPQSKSYCRKTIRQEAPLDIQDAVAEGWEDDPAYEHHDLGCYIGGPVVVDGETYGALCFADKTSRDHAFDDTERAFVELLVQWVTHELNNEAFETKLREINNTAQQLMTVSSKSEIASITAKCAKSILQTPITGVWWYEDELDSLVPVLMTDKATDYLGEQPTFDNGTALAWDAFETGDVQVYDDLSAVDRLHNEETILNSEAVVPLGDHGIMTAGSVEPRAFSETDINLLEVLSSTVEAALTRTKRETVLRETQAELKQSNEELEQFAYAASHDLQEPLRTVSNYLTLLERRHGEDLDGDAADFIAFAVDGADRMRNMIQALLAYSRVDTRRKSFEPVAVGELFEQVTDSLSVKIAETDATVSTPATAATVRGDSSQLAQLFQNLVDNGIKYNLGQPEIDISVRSHEDQVTIAVTDDGIGIKADRRGEIFEVFQRLHAREEFDGTGIGLSICRKIIDRHGGDIDVQSQPGAGSTFSITLPGGGAADE
jgi:PAS domain S-box-containing protein